MAFDAATFTDYTVGADVDLCRCASGDVAPNRRCRRRHLWHGGEHRGLCQHGWCSECDRHRKRHQATIHYIPGGVFAAIVVIRQHHGRRRANLVAENVVIDKWHEVVVEASTRTAD
jgi:hypothetical protein